MTSESDSSLHPDRLVLCDAFKSTDSPEEEDARMYEEFPRTMTEF